MSIIIPPGFNEYTILGIDPGVNNFGVSIYKIQQFDKPEIKSIDAFTLRSNKLRDISGLDEDNITERNIKIHKIKNHLFQILVDNNPVLVICESPFYNPSMPTAYASLVQIIQAAHYTCLEYNNNINFVTIEPLLVKKTIGAGMTTGKIDVKESVKNTPSIMSKLIVNIEELDEHSIDAIAIPYSYLKINFLVNF